ncbi:exonuclease SbcCD subunit D [Glaciihabitans sp. dw_435]|uniref:exonuclease SbcCD subunit D n=1 Tax=Glaciihabitans sp. dw_435 TaxID=2720081 RepID=UPI001BD50F12|nr:exonuclease SbcCD subunit D [Glaciihabitans sp. dw_435]
MKILHTSDWHIGRTFHGQSTLDHLRQVFGAMVEIVKQNDVDVVVVSGDIFDSSMPSAENFTVLSTVLRDIKAAGASVVMTSGNHDSATRLGFQSEWAGLAGIHVITGFDQYLRPIIIEDEYGPVNFYGIPYLEPSLIRHHYPSHELKTHEQVLTFAMDGIRADIARSDARSVVLSHCFVSDVAASSEATDVERDITAGGLNLVPAAAFDGPDYVALGHIHGRTTITERVRYSGAPLHYSFGEAAKPRGGWLVTLDAGGLDEVTWIDFPVPRRLSVLTDDLEALLSDATYASAESDWVCAILTDRVRPVDAMRRLQRRFPFCAMLEHRPSVVVESSATTYGERVKQKTDREIVAGFLEHVRNGVGPSEFETDIVNDVFAEQRVKEASE